MDENEKDRKDFLRKSKVNLSRLVELHKLYVAYIPYRGIDAQKLGQSFLGFNDDGWSLMCLMTIATVMSRHVRAIKRLLSAKYPVQALILFRALIEAWFYTIMYFAEPDRAEDYLKNPTNKGKPKYRPSDVKNFALQIVRKSSFPRASEFADVITEQYRIACSMVHMSDPLMFASFGIFSGESVLQLDNATENDKYLYVAYGRILYVSSAFWMTLLFSFLSEDRHELTRVISIDIYKYSKPVLKLMWGPLSEAMEKYVEFEDESNLE